MVKIAIAAGSGNVAQEIIDVLVATKKHEILLLSRKARDVTAEIRADVTWVHTNYEDPQKLAEILHGVHTVLSFIVVHSDTDNKSQKHLIDAAVEAGVKRFAPSEWASQLRNCLLTAHRSSFEHMSWFNGKAEIREYLKMLNKDNKNRVASTIGELDKSANVYLEVLEYSLFQPGFFWNYFTYPYKTSNHVAPIETPIDFNTRRALMVDGSDDSRITLTTVQDIANIVARAVEYDGEWPVVGGIKGTELTMGQLIALGENIRGGHFAVERLKAEDLEAGEVKASWLPKAGHPSFPPEQFDAISAMLLSGILLGISAGALNVSDEWNRLLPDYKFTQAENFLTEAWRGKP
ncbi:hypothetical protein TOPH_05289 [Tolypocladium ophioglossoides CBS 100239]|uniref:NmrA-like domain-containing protein n=1 Tax=Tolypocladium ophioglossoides (strain CBS 100239) TaxID=1163406 RepID=A0A0L0N7A4_TOLOC|nr:hypothetical protein TOPH_05289 [Tolypocladium ophioglossoides CBS 100239]